MCVRGKRQETSEKRKQEPEQELKESEWETKERYEHTQWANEKSIDCETKEFFILAQKIKKTKTSGERNENEDETRQLTDVQRSQNELNKTATLLLKQNENCLCENALTEVKQANEGSKVSRVIVLRTSENEQEKKLKRVEKNWAQRER